jgi:hypothetical protein
MAELDAGRGEPRMNRRLAHTDRSNRHLIQSHKITPTLPARSRPLPTRSLPYMSYLSGYLPFTQCCVFPRQSPNTQNRHPTLFLRREATVAFMPLTRRGMDPSSVVQRCDHDCDAKECYQC